MDMTLHPSAWDIALRLFLTVIAGAAIGINREAGGHSAGFRTTVLAGLAAALAMILANLMLEVDGKTPGSFAVMDPMRLPLGILTGMGFIGGGAILKQGTMISGVTTAATLWTVTVVGLCFGSGHLLLGCAGTGLILLTLVGFKWIDLRVPRQRRAHVVIAGTPEAPSVAEVYGMLSNRGYRPSFLGEADREKRSRLVNFEIRWDQAEIDGPPLVLLDLLKEKYDVRSFEIIAEGMH